MNTCSTEGYTRRKDNTCPFFLVLLLSVHQVCHSCLAFQRFSLCRWASAHICVHFKKYKCTSPKHPVSCMEPGLVICSIYDIIHVSMPFSQEEKFYNIKKNYKWTYAKQCSASCFLYHIMYLGHFPISLCVDLAYFLAE